MAIGMTSDPLAICFGGAAIYDDSFNTASKALIGLGTDMIGLDLHIDRSDVDIDYPLEIPCPNRTVRR
jgi:hypothetical protein